MSASLFAAVAMLLRKELIQAMERLGERIDVGEAVAIQRIRRVHSAALTIAFNSSSSSGAFFSYRKNSRHAERF